MLLQRIQQQFLDSADLKYQCAQTLGPQVELAVRALLACVTSGGKVLACGSAQGAAQVQAFAAAFLGRFERERPELPAVALGANAVVLNGLYGHFEARAVYARQVRALGQPGDVLLLVTAQPGTPEILGAVEAAHERDMVVMALCGASDDTLARQLRDTDVLLPVPGERAARVMEVHQLVLHCLCDGVDAQLLGDEPGEPEMKT